MLIWRKEGGPIKSAAQAVCFCFRGTECQTAMLMAALAVTGSHGQTDEGPEERVVLEPHAPQTWATGIGEGFRPGAQTVGFGLGTNIGYAWDWDNESHQLVMAAVSYGRMLGPVVGTDHWYKGNWEVRGELFAGGQYLPEAAWFVGFTPVVRYNIATGTHLVPFIEAGMGVTATSIGGPDLGGTFQFNERVGFGSHYFFQENAAWSGEAFYVHWSNGGIREPNAGLNGVTVLLGMTVFF